MAPNKRGKVERVSVDEFMRILRRLRRVDPPEAARIEQKIREAVARLRLSC